MTSKRMVNDVLGRANATKLTPHPSSTKRLRKEPVLADLEPDKHAVPDTDVAMEITDNAPVSTPSGTRVETVTDMEINTAATDDQVKANKHDSQSISGARLQSMPVNAHGLSGSPPDKRTRDQPPASLISPATSDTTTTATSATPMSYATAAAKGVSFQ
jgi:hypothetical protein